MLEGLNIWWKIIQEPMYDYDLDYGTWMDRSSFHPKQCGKEHV